MLLRRGNWPIATTRYGGGVKLQYLGEALHLKPKT